LKKSWFLSSPYGRENFCNEPYQRVLEAFLKGPKIKQNKLRWKESRQVCMKSFHHPFRYLLVDSAIYD
jgi:hypothetical protein